MVIRSFIHYLQFEKRFSPHTIAAYESDLSQFFSYLERIYELKDSKEVTHQHLRSWIVSLVTEGNEPRSVNRKMSSLRAYFKFRQRDGLVTVNPTTRLRALKIPGRLPNHIQESQARKMITSGSLVIPPIYWKMGGCSKPKGMYKFIRILSGQRVVGQSLNCVAGKMN